MELFIDLCALFCVSLCGLDFCFLVYVSSLDFSESVMAVHSLLSRPAGVACSSGMPASFVDWVAVPEKEGGQESVACDIHR